jgi:hypothetical protein
MQASNAAQLDMARHACADAWLACQSGFSPRTENLCTGNDPLTRRRRADPRAASDV